MRQDRLPSIRHVKFPKGYRGWDEGYIHVGPEDGRRYHVTSLRLITSTAALYPHRHDWHCDLRVGMTTFRTKGTQNLLLAAPSPSTMLPAIFVYASVRVHRHPEAG